MIDIDQSFFQQYPTTHAHDLKVKFTDFEILQIKYYIKVFKELVFSKPNDGFGSYFAWWQIEVQSLLSPRTMKWRGNIGGGGLVSTYVGTYICSPFVIALVPTFINGF